MATTAVSATAGQRILSASPPPRHPIDNTEPASTPHQDVALEDADTPAEVGLAMAQRHQDLVSVLVAELKRSQERFQRCRERLSHTLVLLDESQLALVSTTKDRDELSNANTLLEAEVARLLSENHRLRTANESLTVNAEANHALAQEALSESERNRALLHQSLRFGRVAVPETLTATRAAAAIAAAAGAQRRLQQEQPITEPLLRDTVELSHAKLPGPAGGAFLSPPAPRTVAPPLPGPGGQVNPSVEVTSPPIHLPDRPLTRVADPHQRADHQRADLQRADLQRADLQRADLQRADLQRAVLESSMHIKLSEDGYVASATSDAPGAATALYPQLSTPFSTFSATVHSRNAARAAVGIASRTLAVLCVLRGDGTLVVECQGSHIETKLSPDDDIRPPPPPHEAATWSVSWNATTRKIAFTCGPHSVGTPVVLPPPFATEQLSPVVSLPCRGDDVVLRLTSRSAACT